MARVTPGTTDWGPLLNTDLDGIEDTATAALDAVQAIPVPGTTEKTRVLIIGSSNAAGVGATGFNGTAGSAPGSWAQLLATTYADTHEFTNLAVSGLTPAAWTDPAYAGDPVGGYVAVDGLTILEQAIRDHRPHIAILALTMQNMPGGYPDPIDSLRVVDLAVSICERYRVRPLAITPYISTGYGAASKDLNNQIVRTLKGRGWPLLNFSQIYGPNGPIALIDSGDGLHVNDVGHGEQFRQIPPSYLDLRSAWPSRIVFPDLPGIPQNAANAALGSGSVPVADTFPPGNFPTANTALLPALPAGSWTFGIRANMNSGGAKAVFAEIGRDMRVRFNPNGDGHVDIAFGASATVAATGAITDLDQEHHYALSYDDLTGTLVLYVDGVQVASGTAPSWDGPGYWPWNSGSKFNIGSRADGTSQAAAGSTFRHLTLHSTVLDAAEVAELAQGIVAPTNLWLAAHLAGEAISGRTGSTSTLMAAQHGNPPRLRVPIA